MEERKRARKRAGGVYRKNTCTLISLDLAFCVWVRRPGFGHCDGKSMENGTVGARIIPFVYIVVTAMSNCAQTDIRPESLFL